MTAQEVVMILGAALVIVGGLSIATGRILRRNARRYPPTPPTIRSIPIERPAKRDDE